MVAQLEASLDNLAIDDKDQIFVSNMADNGIQEVDPETGAAKQVIIGKLALPGGIGVVSDERQGHDLRRRRVRLSRRRRCDRRGHRDRPACTPTASRSNIR